MPAKKKADPKQQVIEVVPQYEGKTDLERVFGPKVVLAKHGRVELTDHMAKTRARLDQDRAGVRKMLSYEAFYQFAGGVLGFITKRHGEPWRLSITMSDTGSFPQPRPESFETWQDAWKYVTEKMPA